MKVLVLWSGGVESTSLLKHLLTETDDEIVAHHIVRENPENRALSETNAIHELYPHLLLIRPFVLSKSFISVCDGEAWPMDYAIDYPIGIQAMYYHQCSRIYRAGCLEDDWDHTEANGVTSVTRPSPVPGFSHLRRARTLSSLLRTGDGNVVAPYLEHYKHSKAWHMKYLADLAALTWSCRRPISGNPCGKCHSCLERTAALSGTSMIPEVAQLLLGSEF